MDKHEVPGFGVEGLSCGEAERERGRMRKSEGERGRGKGGADLGQGDCSLCTRAAAPGLGLNHNSPLSNPKPETPNS